MRKFLIYSLILFSYSKPSFSALPFVTDDAGIANQGQVSVETFTEQWSIPKKDESYKTTMIGQYLGLSYGTKENLEITAAGLIGYDSKKNTSSFMNPALQLKSNIYQSKTSEVPSVSMSFGYVNKNGKGEYYDSANNFYLLGIATSKFFDNKLIAHVNFGPKTSFDIKEQKNVYRLQLGIGFDVKLSKEINFIFESYNGAANSPRDSSGLFHSYQTGIKLIKSTDLSFHILYGSQPTFYGYGEDGHLNQRRTSWIQFGIRKVIDNIL